jgi:hypothetical protein
VLDLRLTHVRCGSMSKPSLNGSLDYPADKDRTLNETVIEKIMQCTVMIIIFPLTPFPYPLIFLTPLSVSTCKLVSSFIPGTTEKPLVDCFRISVIQPVPFCPCCLLLIGKTRAKDKTYCSNLIEFSS